MLRLLVSSRSTSLLQRRLLHGSTPSTTTSVLLTKLPKSVTLDGLKGALADIRHVRTELEPGCSIHFNNEAEADAAAHFFETKLQLESQVVPVSLPSVTLKNIPLTLDSESILSNFQQFEPRGINLNLNKSVCFTMETAEDVVNAINTIKTQINEAYKTSISKDENSNYLVNVFNFPPNKTVEEVSAELSTKLSSTTVTPTTSQNSRKITIRLNDEKDDKIDRFFKSLDQKSKEEKWEISASKVSLKKPVVFVKNIEHAEKSDFMKLISNIKTDDVRFISKSRESKPNSAYLYFKNEDIALQSLALLKNALLLGKRFPSFYQEIAEPAVKISNLPPNTTEEQIKEIFSALHFAEICKIENTGDSTTAVLKLESPEDVNMCIMTMSGKKFGESFLVLEDCGFHDNAIEIKYTGSAESSNWNPEEISKVLVDESVSFRDISISSGFSADIFFSSLLQARKAQHRFLSGKASIFPEKVEGNVTTMPVISSLNYLPSYTLQVRGLDTNTPATQLIESLEDHFKFPLNVLQVDRSALVKFKKNSHVVPNMKVLKNIQLNGENFKVARYRPLSTPHEDLSEYDTPGSESRDEELNREFTRKLMGDGFDTDPAIRYRTARNMFERALNDAAAFNEFSLIVSEKDSEKMKSDGMKYFNDYKNILESFEKEDSRHVKNDEKINFLKIQKDQIIEKLFDLYIQREDMAFYAKNFKELTAFAGSIDTKDKTNWSQLSLTDNQELHQFVEKVKELEEKVAADKFDSSILKSENQTENEEIVSFDDSELTIDGTKINVEKYKLNDLVDQEDFAKFDPENPEALLNKREDDPAKLKDKDGNVWSGIILTTDMVQKIMPGNPVNTHRALVVVGNLRGTGGYGVGKGKTVQDAINSAFRASLRNLLHIDLYDNFGLAHNLYGKHNACHAYIKATPSSRAFIGSPFAFHVLRRFGISSASVKLKGRRDSYNMVKAIFNALADHENIDEIAKARGKRYLTLRWAQNHGI